VTGFLPEGLSSVERRELDECVERAAAMSLEDLLSKGRNHLEETRAACERNPILDLSLAEALLRSIEILVAEWSSVPGFAQPWCKGMILYFVSTN